MKKMLNLCLLFSFMSHAQLSQAFKQHWFDGYAEINSYTLTQSRYGEQRQGSAVLIFVTEEFLANEQVKANKRTKTTFPVLKSNRTKNFLTGIYPYSIMSSTFSSLKKGHPLIKSVASIQEWCGQSYLQLNTFSNDFTLISHSYFEGEADQLLNLPVTITEDELWNQVRYSPKKLPTGEFDLLPALELIRLNHLPIKPYRATAQLEKGKYSLTIPSLQRQLIIYFSTEFPYTIEGWEEYYTNKGTDYSSIAKRIHTERRQYWRENDRKSESLRTPFKLN